LSIRLRIFFGLLAFSVVPMLLLAVVWLVTDSEKISGHYEEDLETLAAMSASSFRDIIKLSGEDVILLASNLHMQNFLNNEADDSVSDEDKSMFRASLQVSFIRFTDQLELFDDIILLNADGQVELASSPEVLGRDLHDRAYFTDNKAENVFVCRVHDSLTQPDNPNMKSLALSYRITNDDGSLRYMLVVFLNAVKLGKLISDTTFDNSGIVYVVDRDNFILHHPDPRFANSYAAAHKTIGLINRYSNGEIPAAGLIEDVLDGVRRVYYYTILPDINMAVVLRQNYDEYTDFIYHHDTSMMIISVIACVLLTAGAGLWYSRLSVRPIKRLKERVASSVRVGDIGGGELGDIAKSFDAMTDKLDRQKQLINDEIAANEYAAGHDGITGLLNRPAFEKEFTGRLKGSTSVGVVFIDIGHFKQINDTYGHLEGDAVLAETGRRIKRSAAGFDVCARAGSAQFIAAKSGDEDAISDALKTLRQEFAEPFFIGSRRAYILLHIGVAVYPRDGLLPKALIGAADIAMRQAKAAQSRSHLFYDVKMREGLDRVNAVTEALRGCFVSGDIFLMYQPVYNLSDNSVIGFEALARIRNRKLGLLSPTEFIPIAENERSLTDEISRFTVRTALRFLRRLIDIAGYGGCVSVNISFRQMESPGFEGIVTDALTETGVPQKRLCLEIAELKTNENTDAVIEKLRKLREQGVVIVQDGLGGSRSSLYYAAHMLFDAIKVNQAFFRGYDKEKHYRQLNKTVLEIAKRFNMLVIAGHAETKEDIEAIEAAGFENAQGFYFSLPLMEDSAVELI
jgi:diguanylate cyclase (GGDEF)-like protein